MSKQTCMHLSLTQVNTTAKSDIFCHFLTIFEAFFKFQAM